MMVLNKYSSYLRYTILKTETGILSLMIKEIFMKVYALYNNDVYPENESLKGLFYVIDVGGSIYTQSA